MEVWGKLEKVTKSGKRGDKWPDVEPCCTANELECTDYYDVYAYFEMRPYIALGVKILRLTSISPLARRRCCWCAFFSFNQMTCST